MQKVLMALLPQAVKDQLARQEAEIAALKAWQAKVEAVWPQIVEVTNGTG